MALTPEQILNKHFQTTQFRKGYDERDVDDFLDDVVAEMRALTAQRDDYKHQFEECQSRTSSSVQDRGSLDPAVVEEHEKRLEDVKSRLADAESREKEVNERLFKAQADLVSAVTKVQAQINQTIADINKKLRE